MWTPFLGWLFGHDDGGERGGEQGGGGNGGGGGGGGGGGHGGHGATLRVLATERELLITGEIQSPLSFHPIERLPGARLTDNQLIQMKPTFFAR